jgi:hypothetical protein
MGKSGWLPDVSSNFFFYRTLAINCLQKRDYNGAAAALYDLMDVWVRITWLQ